MFRLTHNAENARLDSTLTISAAEIHSPFAHVEGQKMTDNVIHFRGDGQAALSKLYLHLLNAALDEKKGCAFLHARKPFREDEHSDDRHAQHSQVSLLKFPKPAYSLR
jgi:hypothetical protein